MCIYRCRDVRCHLRGQRCRIPTHIPSLAVTPYCLEVLLLLIGPPGSALSINSIFVTVMPVLPHPHLYRRNSERHLADPTGEFWGHAVAPAPSGISRRTAACFKFSVRCYTPAEGHGLTR